MTKNDKNLLKQMIEAGKFSYEMYVLLIEQNKANSKAMIKRMGNKWVCHKDNHVKRLEVPADLLNAHRGSRILSQIKRF
jgi:hypothetical protein